jgi:hypothetical protein
MTYENPWLFNNAPFTEDMVGESYGFVYLILCKTTGKKYVGRKYFYSKRKRKKKDTRRTTSGSDWQEYYGSSDELLALVEQYGKHNFVRKILSLHKTAGDTNIAEVKEQFKRNVLEDDTYLNSNINGKWRKPPQHIIDARRFSIDKD